MPPRNRANPLALAVLICLGERPMHPYEVATTLRQRNKHESVRLNYGSLYAVVEALERRGLIVPQETERSGRLPERTVYGLTDAGRVEIRDWLTDLISTPVNDYPSFEAALSFLPALSPGNVVALLQERAQRIEIELAQARAALELVEKQQIPRLFWVESEFHTKLREAEFAYVKQLAEDIESGSLNGVEWWAAVHEGNDPSLQPPLLQEDHSPENESSADRGGRSGRSGR